MSQTEIEINQILNDTHRLIDNLKLKLNLNKCEFIAPLNSKPIIDEITQHTIQPTTDAKYLGQILDTNGSDYYRRWLISHYKNAHGIIFIYDVSGVIRTHAIN